MGQRIFPRKFRVTYPKRNSPRPKMAVTYWYNYSVKAELNRYMICSAQRKVKTWGPLFKNEAFQDDR